MNVAGVIGEVVSEPKVFTMSENQPERMVLFTVRVPGIKEDWETQAYDECIPVRIPLKIMGSHFNSLKQGSFAYVTGALMKGRYLTHTGGWEITVGISASDVNPIRKAEFDRNKEEAKKSFGRGEREDE